MEWTLYCLLAEFMLCNCDLSIRGEEERGRQIICMLITHSITLSSHQKTNNQHHIIILFFARVQGLCLCKLIPVFKRLNENDVLNNTMERRMERWMNDNLCYILDLVS
jgi:hypothetical protein